MQFLKSTLFPSNFGKRKTSQKDETIQRLERRIHLLEEENKKSAAAIEEMTNYIGQISAIITTLATEFTFVASQVAVLAENSDDVSIKTYLKPDDDGYIH